MSISVLSRGCILFLLLILFTKSYGQSSIALSYLTRAKNEIVKDQRFVKSLLKSNDSWSLYKLAPSLDSYNNLFLVTKDEKYLLYSIDIVSRVISLSEDVSKLKASQFKDKARGWVNRSNAEKGDDGKEYALYESYFWRYVTSLLLIIKENNLDSKYRTFFNNTLRFSEKSVYDKWKLRGANNIFRENTNMSALWAHICYDLFKLTNNKDYWNVCENFNNRFTDVLVKNIDGSFFWNSFWDKRKHSKLGQDVSHANAEVSYFVEAHSRGDFFHRDFLNGLIKTLKNVIIKENGSTSYYLDGSGNSKMRISDGFLKLGRFDKSLQNSLRKLSPIQESEYYRYIQFYSVMALNEFYEN